MTYAIETKPSKSGKRTVYFPTVNGKRISITNFGRKWEAQKLLKVAKAHFEVA